MQKDHRHTLHRHSPAKTSYCLYFRTRISQNTQLHLINQRSTIITKVNLNAFQIILLQNQIPIVDKTQFNFQSEKSSKKHRITTHTTGSERIAAWNVKNIHHRNARGKPWTSKTLEIRKVKREDEARWTKHSCKNVSRRRRVDRNTKMKMISAVLRSNHRQFFQLQSQVWRRNCDFCCTRRRVTWE